MAGLTSGLIPDPGDPTLALDTQREPQLATGGGLVEVYLTNAVRTSAGPGPGVVRVPVAEANRLISARCGVRGTQPPRNFLDGRADRAGDPGQGVRQHCPGEVGHFKLGGAMTRRVITATVSATWPHSRWPRLRCA
jgi:hypothetical protein